MTEQTCTCLPLAETFERGMHGKPVPRCELHGTIGSAGDQGSESEALALNSQALEDRLASSLGIAVDKVRHPEARF